MNFFRNPEQRDLSTADAQRLTESLRPLMERAKGASWYSEHGNDVDLAVARLCLLRRARAGEHASALAGDEAVRELLEDSDRGAVAWLLTRAVSYMDEQGFPDFVPGARLGD
jgi:hypothetical protein